MKKEKKLGKSFSGVPVDRYFTVHVKEMNTSSLRTKYCDVPFESPLVGAMC
jgi:hypothetical protein